MHIRGGFGGRGWMLAFYVAAAILGAGLILVALLGGHDHGSDHSVADHGHVAGHDPAQHDGSGASGSGGAGEVVLGLLRPRNLTFFLAGFGLTGTLGTLVGAAGAPLTLLLALGVGTLAMVATHGVFLWLARTESAADVLSETELEGALGRVVLPFGPGERGRVACIMGGRDVHLVARLAEGAGRPVASNQEIVVMRVVDGVAEVIPLGERELPPSSM